MNKNCSAALPGASQGGGPFPSPPDDRRLVGAESRISIVLVTNISRKAASKSAFRRDLFLTASFT